MLIYPAIDLYEGKAVRLLKGDYAQMTVYSDDPPKLALDFKAKGAAVMHMVDLQGARDNSTPNFEVARRIKEESGLFCELGGGIRSLETIRAYREAGIDRLILGTAAAMDPGFTEKALAEFGAEHIAVGVDLRDGCVAVKGWKETLPLKGEDFFHQLSSIGVKTVICTDISRDGAMKGSNRALYKELSERFSLDIIASGGVSTIDEVKELAAMGLYGAIIGKAYYTGAIDLREAIEVSK